MATHILSNHALCAQSWRDTNAQARKIVDDYLAVQRDRVALLDEYVEPFSKVLPGRTLMRFYQIENKIHTVLLYEIAETIPVIAQAEPAQ